MTTNSSVTGNTDYDTRRGSHWYTAVPIA